MTDFSDNERIRKHDAVVEFIRDERFIEASKRIAKDAVEHVLVRLGVSAEDAKGVIESQESNAYLRQLRKSDIEGRMSRVEAWQTMHERQCADRQRQILDKLDESARDRSAIKKRLDSALAGLLLLLIGIVGYFLARHGLTPT